ncbi:phosphorelay intermediate protein Ypd1p [Monosporozyma unispora]|nr:Phosphorelay intermediate protein [Kazachstania unispora]
MIDTIPSEVINWNILNEIISMDEDDPEFSKSLITQYIDQAITTFGQMDEHLVGDKDLKELDSLGHFLKGSSAALGLQRIAWVCERIQNLGRKSENVFPNRIELLSTLPSTIGVDAGDLSESNDGQETVENSNGDELYLNLIRQALSQARIEFKLARKELSHYYKTEL